MQHARPQPKRQRPLARAQRNTTFQWERYTAISAEVLPLMRRHWAEIEVKDTLDPDFERYFAMDRAGIIRIFTARSNGVLVGYTAFLVSPDIMCKHRIIAAAHCFWLDPLEREGWTGVKMLRDCEEGLKAWGASIIEVRPKLDFCNDRGHSVATIMRRLKYRPTEMLYSKRL